jgi:hypothetical protein
MSQASAEEASRKRAAFIGKAAAAYDRMCGGDGQNGLVSFEEREGRACVRVDR